VVFRDEITPIAAPHRNATPCIPIFFQQTFIPTHLMARMKSRGGARLNTVAFQDGGDWGGFFPGNDPRRHPASKRAPYLSY